jgi:hypothetical protein
MKIKARYGGEDLGAAEGLLVAVAQLLDPLKEGGSLRTGKLTPFGCG